MSDGGARLSPWAIDLISWAIAFAFLFSLYTNPKTLNLYGLKEGGRSVEAAVEQAEDKGDAS